MPWVTKPCEKVKWVYFKRDKGRDKGRTFSTQKSDAFFVPVQGSEVQGSHQIRIVNFCHTNRMLCTRLQVQRVKHWHALNREPWTCERLPKPSQNPHEVRE
jgi:hypothetical protein